MALRILVVDDFEPWRRFVSSTLQSLVDVQKPLEVSDGLEAVYNAESFRPDIILLDIGLPTLDGIKAASRIREVSPDSKILFLSQENSPEVVQAALHAGGSGYVVKSDAGRELLAAARALRDGNRYISTRLAGQVFFAELDEDPSGYFDRHMHQVYPSDSAFLKGFTTFIGNGLNAGNAVVVFATKDHRNGLVEMLERRGFNVEAIVNSGSYIEIDAQEALSEFMMDDQPDIEHLANFAQELVKTASRAPNGALRRVLVSGECSALLWGQGKVSAALRAEKIWDSISRQYRLRTLCGYIAGILHGQKSDQVSQAIQALHSIHTPCDHGAAGDFVVAID